MILYTDGGCSNNQQKDLSKRKMVAVVTDEFGKVVSEQHADGGSNNIAELLAVRNALKYCLEEQIPKVKVITDSRNNLAWVYGKKVGKNINDRETVLKLKAQIYRLMQMIDLELEWAPREFNRAGRYIETKYTL